MVENRRREENDWGCDYWDFEMTPLNTKIFSGNWIKHVADL